MRADRRTEHVVRAVRDRATQSRIASSIAARSVRSPLVTGTTVAPSSFMRPTFGAWRSMSTAPMYTVHGRPTRAQAAADRDAVLAGAGLGDDALARRAASRAAPGRCALLILCAPVCARSSRLSQTSAPQRLRQRRRVRERASAGRPSSRSSRVELGLELRRVQDAARRRLRAARAPAPASRARSGRRTGRSGRARRDIARPARRPAVWPVDLRARWLSSHSTPAPPRARRPRTSRSCRRS